MNWYVVYFYAGDDLVIDLAVQASDPKQAKVVANLELARRTEVPNEQLLAIDDVIVERA